MINIETMIFPWTFTVHPVLYFSEFHSSVLSKRCLVQTKIYLSTRWFFEVIDLLVLVVTISFAFQYVTNAIAIYGSCSAARGNITLFMPAKAFLDAQNRWFFCQTEYNRCNACIQAGLPCNRPLNSSCILLITFCRIEPQAPVEYMST